jgi:hypothetical protein
MRCPRCTSENPKAAYRCSNCGAWLAAPGGEGSEAAEEALTALWKGNDAALRQELTLELERAGIPYVEVPLVDEEQTSSWLPRLRQNHLFDFVVRVRQKDWPSSNQILEGIQERRRSRDDASAEPVASNAESEESASQPAEPDADLYLQPASVEIWAGEDRARGRFICFALREVGIPAGLERDDARTHVFVAPKNEKWARGIVAQIVDGVAPEGSSPVDLAWVDTPPESYLLAWLLPLLYLAMAVTLESLVGRSISDGLAGFVKLIDTIGTIWMVYQAIRFEIRPVSYCIIALFPLTFIWYYIERYSQRRGGQRLPVAVRLRA